MGFRDLVGIVLLLFGLVTASEAWGTTSEEPLKAWTPEVSIGLRSFITDAVNPSPHGTMFFFITSHADRSCDCSVHELYIFKTKDVLAALRSERGGDKPTITPFKVMTRSSWIDAPAWDPSEEFISFRGLDEKGISQLYRYDLGTGATQALTHAAYNSDSLFKSGDVFVSAAWVPREDDSGYSPVHELTNWDLRDAIFGQRVQPLRTIVWKAGAEPWEVRFGRAVPGLPASVSPDGRWAIAFQYPASPASYYSQYEVTSDQPEFVLLNLVEHRADSLIGAPSGFASKAGGSSGLIPTALWSLDAKHVIAVNTMLPINGEPTRGKIPYIVDVRPEDRSWSILEPLVREGKSGELEAVSQVGWLVTGRELLVTHRSGNHPASGTVYTLTKDRWIPRLVPATVAIPVRAARVLEGGLSVDLEQSATEPPMMVAKKGASRLPLLPPDPALVGVWRAEPKPHQWKEPNGRVEQGGLLLPKGVSAGQRANLPLVIQAYTYAPTRFEPDGPFAQLDAGAYSGQSLVAQGLVVLNINIPSQDSPYSGTVDELREFVERIQSAVDSLTSDGLVDRSRVGYIGFSRAGYLGRYAVTHPGERPLAAAIIDDAYPGTYPYYLTLAALGADGREMDRMYMGSLWQNPQSWLKLDPGFNVDRVRTPVLFTVHKASNIYSLIDTVGAFRLNKKPMDVYVFPTGEHLLGIPSQRLASQQLSVDWMRFWLQGSEDSDSRKSEQYRRWRELRSNWARQK